MQQTLRANALQGWPTSFDGIEVLSLDCFDTLLWRKVAAPTDVFFALEKSTEFQARGLTAALRARAEQNARQANRLTGRGSEVTIEQVYQYALPQATTAQIDELVARELACEAEHCFIFKPVFDLILRARAAGVRIVIVSDTYFSEAQLRRLLFTTMPALEPLLDSVFCSSTRGLSKAAGIWRALLPILKVPAASIMHLGDNEQADLFSPASFGINSAHLVPQADRVKQIMQSRDQAAVQVLPDIRYRDPLPSHHHGAFALHQGEDPFDTMGYVALGPVMHAFAEFIIREASDRQSTMEHGQVRLAFLLRDGYLPSKACAAFAGDTVGVELNISRFTAIAATLDGKERVVALLSRMLSPDSLEALAKQLQLPPEMASRILKRASRAENPAEEFAALVLQKDTLNVIVAQSRAFRRRLVAHVQKKTGVRPGDTLMFVDLGYSGTAQTLLKDVFKRDMGVDLIGRYLICENVAPHQSDRKGLIDASRQDGRIVGALTGQYIAGFEMLCAQNAPSTIGYTEDGEPLFASSSLGKVQHAAVNEIQSACLRFIADERALPSPHKPSRPLHELSQSVAIDLTRLLYFPSQLEIEAMSQFQFDFNLGTDKKLDLFDPVAGLRDMRRLGFGYMNAGLDTLRTNYPTELRYLDLSLSALLLAQNRFSFGVQLSTVSYRIESVPALVANGSGQACHELEAVATFDGWFALSVPVSDGFDVGIVFGSRYRWVQIDSVQLAQAGDVNAAVDMTLGEAVLVDQMTHEDNGLFRVAPAGMLFVPANPAYKKPGTICRIVFRPLASAAIDVPAS
jgi:FMN phosphatase YigB (HAD superfamily)